MNKTRDDFSAATKEALAKRVGFHCSNPGCRQLTSGPQTRPTKTINVGVAAHITAAAPGGPRYDASLTVEQRQSIENGMWLCQNCAKLIDSDELRYTVELLRAWKKDAEAAALSEIEGHRPEPHSADRTDTSPPSPGRRLPIALIAALLIGLFVVAAIVWSWWDGQQPTAYMEIVLDNGPVPQPHQLDDLKTVLQKELSRALPDAALALRVFGPRCGETRQVVHFSTGNATEVASALGDVYPEAQADLTEAIRQAINDLLKRKGDQPRVVVVVTWGQEGCGEDLEQALAGYREQLGTSVALYILNRGAGLMSLSQPGVYAVQALDDTQLGTVISDLKGALAAGRWPPTPMPKPTSTYTPTPTNTPTPTDTPTQAASGRPRLPVPRSASAISVDNAAQVSQAAAIDAVRGEDLDWSADGTLLALTAGYEVHLYDAQGSPVRVIKPAGWSTHVAFSPDGATLAVASDKGVGLWEAATGAELGAAPGIPRAADVAFSPDGTLLAVAVEETVKVVEVAGGQELYLLIHGDGVNSVAFSPDGKMVASSSNYEVKLWLLGQEEAVQTLKRGTAGRTMAFSPDGKLLATDEGQTIKLWDVASGLGQGTLSGHNDAVSSVAFSPDGTVLASASADLTVRLWDMAKRRELRRVKGHTADVLQVVFSPDGAVAASASSDRTIRLWSVPPGGVVEPPPTRAASGRIPTPVPRSASAISVDNAAQVSQAAAIDAVRGEDLDWSADGTLLALTAGYEVHLYDAQGSPVRVIKPAGWSTHVAFSPDGATLAVASDKGVELWEAATGAELGAVPGIPRAADVAFSPDGTLLAVAVEETVKVVEAAGGQELYLLIHGDGVNSVAFSPDGKMVASSSNYEVKLWLLGQEEAVQTLKRGTGGWTMAFSPDGKLLATDEGQTIKLWDVVSGLGQGTLSGHGDAVSSVAFSPDGTVLASASADLTVRLWDMAKRRELRRLDGRTDGVLRVVFSPDGAVAASASSDRTIRLWSVPPGGVNPGLD